MAANKSTKIEVRLTPDEKAAWQALADVEGVSVSDLVRSRMYDVRTSVDLDVDELQPLHGWLSLQDSDGVVDEQQLADWRSFAKRSGTTLAEVLRRVVVSANAKHLTA